MPNSQSALRHSHFLSAKNQWELWDDFNHYVTADTWTTTVSDAGTIAVSDAVAGVAVLSPSDGTVADNDEAYLHTTTELFKVGAGAHIYGACRLKVVEANTDDANAFFGFANLIAADTLVDNGGGMRTTGDIFAIFKVDGGTVWKATSSVNGTQTTTESTRTVTSNTYYELRVEVRAVDDTNVEATYYVDDQPLRDSNGKAIKHKVAFASNTEMDCGVGVKNGSANHDKVHVDWIYAAQTPRPSA